MEVQQHDTLSENNEAEPDGVSCKKSNAVQIYRRDVVKNKNSGMIGIAIKVNGDSDFEEGDESNNGGRTAALQTNELCVNWIDGSISTQNFSDVEVIDRGFLHGDRVAAASDPTGQVGVVVDVNMSVNLLAYHDGSIIKDVSSKALKRIRDFTVGDYVVLGSWLGRIDHVLDNVTVLFDDGSVCTVSNADPMNLKLISKDIQEDVYVHYYPGIRVRDNSSSIFKMARWLSGPWKANRLEGTVTNVTVGSVFVYWIASAGYGPYSSTPPAEEQSPKNLKLLSCFAHANWHLGDWCLLPSSALSSSVSINKSKSKLERNNSVNIDHSISVSKDPVHEAWKEKRARKKEENFVISNIRTRVDVEWQDGTIERELDSTSLIPIDNPCDHEFFSEQYVMKKNSDVGEDNSETSRVGVLRSVNPKERTVCVRWIKPAARADDPREFDKEEIVSVYELEGHPDYDYCFGDVVFRLPPVTVCSEASVGESIEKSKQENEECRLNKEAGNQTESASAGETDVEFSDLSWVGNIIGLKNGDIEVIWADGMVSTVGPKAIYVVSRNYDDSDAAGSDISDAASWEDFGRTTALSVPLAALRFVTRLASGIFSRGQNNLDPVHTQSNDEIVCPSPVNVCESSSQECIAPASCDNDACSLKHFDMVTDPSDHYYIGASGQRNNRKWFKKVQQDWGILQNNLPEEIFVRVYEDRMDLVRAVIVGPFGTPYQDGLFFFDFHLPPEYPDVPPSAYYHSGGWRINPNLYEEGEVCLSLLNTWTGRGNEVWDPKSSSILQVLVSLQGLVLNSKPYFNEPGYDKQTGTAEGEKNSLSYNENTFLLNCKTMMYLIRKPPKDFEVLIKEHFKRRGHYILKACDAYMKGYLIGSLNKDASVSNNSSPNSNSVGFKLMLAKIVPKLFLLLSEVGADCEQFMHLKETN
ncbi:putative ubiquitin-conjugating enzyme E2 23 [Trifolium repens]|nr:putative ubiquitin-conjugating enzyme E2 23 [Trifolium repens]